MGELYRSQLWSGVCRYNHDTFVSFSDTEERNSQNTIRCKSDSKLPLSHILGFQDGRDRFVLQYGCVCIHIAVPYLEKGRKRREVWSGDGGRGMYRRRSAGRRIPDQVRI